MLFYCWLNSTIPTQIIITWQQMTEQLKLIIKFGIIKIKLLAIYYVSLSCEVAKCFCFYLYNLVILNIS